MWIAPGLRFCFPATPGPWRVSRIFTNLHEINFYSRLFERASKEKDFGKRLISLLKGNVLEKLPQAESEGMNWMIIKQYLAKHDKNDPRLFIPHVNPEAIHWKKAEQDISYLGKKFANIDIELWLDVDWVGGFFKKKANGEELVSFDLVDVVMSLIEDKGQIKYLYHQQEALWNKVFREYMGSKNLEKLIIENFDKGFIGL